MKRSGTITVFLLVAIILLFFLYLFHDALYAAMDGLHLTPQDDPLTEIYLNDPLGLPRTIQAGDIVSFSFTIHNLEGKPEVYSYLVYLKLTNGKSIFMDNHTVSLADKESKTITESYRFLEALNGGTVFIDIPDFHETLHFVLPRRD